MGTRGVGRSPNDNSEEDTVISLDLKVLGVSTGSGLTQLNLALMRYRRRTPQAPLRIEILEYTTLPVAPVVRARILNLRLEAQHRPLVVASTNAALGQLFASGIKTFCQVLGIPYTAIDLVGTYAPTLRRLPLPCVNNAITHPLGWNTVITAETGITTVFDFFVIQRLKQERYVAPIAYVDRLLLQSPTKFRACLDINELVTLSFIPSSHDSTARESTSFYCGLGNLLIDYAMRYCTANTRTEDHDGRFAARGTVNQVIVDRFINTYSYMRVAPPLHIATEMFGDHEAQRLIDECIALRMSDINILATITRITAQTILLRYRKLVHSLFPQGQQVDELFICGPGARNSNIIDYLEVELPESVITKPLDDIGVPSDANEAVCYAHLALEAVLGQVTQEPARPSSSPVPAMAQVDTDTVAGKIVRGAMWHELVQRAWQFGGGERIPVAKSVSIAGCLEEAVRDLDLQR